MSKITLEDGAQYIAQEGKSITVYEARLAALIRAAQKLVDAAEQIDGGLITFEGCLMLAVTPELVDDLKEKIAEFHKLEEGE